MGTITTTSSSNTPQATDDTFASSTTGLTEDTTTVVILDVMANDLGGKAKSLYSLDDGSSSGSAVQSDLLTSDAGGASNYSQFGARIWITDSGKVAYDITSVPAELLNSIAEGNSAFDTFTYAIRLGNGTLSWATATVEIKGVNDFAIVTSETKQVSEGDDVSAISTSGQLTISDVDSLSEFQPQAQTKGAYGTFSITADGKWSYVADGAHDEFAAGQTFVETFDVVSIDGTQTSVTVTINGTNDAAAITGDATGAADETDEAVTIGGQLAATDVDNAAGFQAGTIVGTNGSLAIDAQGAWTFTANGAFDRLNVDDKVEETFTVKSVDGTEQAITVTINGTSDTPRITAPNEGAPTLLQVSENTTTVTVLSATDVDGNTLVYSIAGGADAAKFQIDAETGALRFVAAPDYETRADASLDNIYDVTVQASDGLDADVQDLAVQVTDVQENRAPIDLKFVSSLDPSGNSMPTGVLGSFVGVDPDAGQALTYSLSSASVPVFAVASDGQLSSTGLGEKTTYTLTVQVTDSQAASYEESFNIITGSNQGGKQSGDDTLPAESGNSLLTGDDILYGGGGNDIIVGGSGDDNLFGQGGRDRLIGGAGNDIMGGSSGNDTFVFLKSDGGGVDTVLGFTASGGNQDVLDISDLLAGSAFTTQNAADYLKLVESSGDTLLQIDLDGSGALHGFQDVALIDGVTGHSLNTWLANGVLDTSA